MAITFPIDYPADFGYSNFSIDLVPVIAATSSPYTLATQVQEHQGVAWRITGSVELLDRASAEIYNTFLLKLNGRLGTFTTFIPGSETPRGVATGTPLVDGASQTGKELDIKGMTPSTTGIFLAGDLLQLGSGSSTRLHKVMNDADTDISGLVTVDIQPKIITAPADNDPVVVSNCKGLFRLDSNSNPVPIRTPNKHTISFSATEVVG